jgi:hypothetical protein
MYAGNRCMSEGSNASKFSTRYSQARRKRVPKADFKRKKKLKKIPSLQTMLKQICCVKFLVSKKCILQQHTCLYSKFYHEQA